MGLLDALFSGSQGGGLLDFLRSNALNQQMPSGLSSDQAQYGQQMNAMPQQFAQANPQPNAQMSVPQQSPPVMQAQPAPQPSVPQQPPPVMQAQQPPQAQPQAPQGPGFMDRLSNGLQSIAQGGSLQGAVRGQYTDPTSIAQQTANLTAKALLAKGVDPQTVQAAVQPGNTEMLKTLITQNFGQGSHTQQTDKDGNVWDVNLQTGQKTISHAAQNDSYSMVQTGENPMGGKTFTKLNKATGEETPPSGASGGAGSGGLIGDESKTGAAYLATVPKQYATVVSGMLDGTLQPPSSFALTKPYWQQLLAAAKNTDPSFDENNWTARHKMSAEIAASGNSSMGGILSNGKSSFKHLAEYTESAADLGNSSHDFPGGSGVATVQNYLANSPLTASSGTRAKIGAINTNLGHFGQESTKFYAATGGGAEERMSALKEMNPTTKSSEEMAAYAEKEKSLMLDRFREKEAQIRDVMGEKYLQEHPVYTPELQRDIARIDANVSKLNGKTTATQSAAAPTIQEGATATNSKTGQKIVFRNGKWQ
jgi:hypothetical protein